ncbi:hypothetical protein EJB05_21148, partial [Eragrostis curvula]
MVEVKPLSLSNFTCSQPRATRTTVIKLLCFTAFSRTADKTTPLVCRARCSRLPGRAFAVPCRSRSWGAGPWTTTTTTTTPPSSRHERSRSATYSPLVSESEGGGLMEEEVMEHRAEWEETTEPRSDGDAAAKREEAPAADERVRILEREVAVSKHTEMKMLESLIHQTKELEQAKIALEEAKLELATLRQQQGDRGAAAAAAEPAAPAPQWSVMDLMFGGVDEEINGLRAKLRAAAVAEERSRKAADDLTAALSAVTMEAKQVKAWLSDAQAEAERANAEAARLKGLLQAAEAELWATTEQIDAVTCEWKDAAAAWRAREKALLSRARAAEDDAAAARRENADLGEENAGLRRALERAVEEASAAGESLEVATGENARLQDAVAEKESALEAARRENEALKASEAAALARAKELDGQLQLAISAAARKASDGGAGGKKAITDQLPVLEKWNAGEVVQRKLGASFLDSGRLVAGRKDRMFASLSNLTELKSAAAAAAMDDYGYEFDHFDDVGQYGDPDHAVKHKKRRSMLRKFGDLFRRRSLYKSNLAPVLHHY